MKYRQRAWHSGHIEDIDGMVAMCATPELAAQIVALLNAAEPKEPLALPTIHMNGTSRQAMLDAIIDASDALRTAIEKLEASAPNARDYYPQGPEAFGIAQRQNDARAQSLATIRAELQTIGEHIVGA